jgi:branched-chain amino acid transport system permease protein
VLRAVRLRLQPLLGYGGLLSFGHAAYFGMASYVSAYPPRLGADARARDPARDGDAAVLGALFGSLAIRRQGIYFAMITLALAQMVFFFSLQAPFTGGEDGIQAVPAGICSASSALPTTARSTGSSPRSFFSGSC